jgi:hypothetical protein
MGSITLPPTAAPLARPLASLALDQIDKLSDIFETLDFAIRKANAELLLDRNHEADIRKAVPFLDVVCAHTVRVFKIIEIKYILDDFGEYFSDLAAFHQVCFRTETRTLANNSERRLGAWPSEAVVVRNNH